jgi:hypothetical protein
MKGLIASWPALALALFFAVALQFSSAGVAAAESAPGGTAPLAVTVFDPSGPDGQPGAWQWSFSNSRWTWQAAQSLGQAGTTQASSAEPARPQNAAVFWYVPTEQAGAYWVWDVYNFGISDGGYSSWVPQWRLANGMTMLGQ